MCGERGDVVECRRMQPDEGLVHHRVDHLVPRRDVRAVVAQRGGEVGHVAVFQLAPLDRFRIADEVEVGVRFPALALESFSALLGGNRRIGAGIRVGEDRIRVLVDGNVAGSGSGGGGCARVAGRRRVRSSTAGGGHHDHANESGQRAMSVVSHHPPNFPFYYGISACNGLGMAHRAPVCSTISSVSSARPASRCVFRRWIWRSRESSTARPSRLTLRTTGKPAAITWRTRSEVSINGVQTSNTPGKSSRRYGTPSADHKAVSRRRWAGDDSRRCPQTTRSGCSPHRSRGRH